MRVGDVGEGGRAFVGGHDEVRIVGIAADDVARRDHFIAAQVVGDVEHAAQERLVRLDAFLLERGAVGGRVLDHEAALRAHRHDDDVLDHLRLHQAEDLGAEVLAAVGPADAAARDLAAAQVDAFHPRRVDEDLEHRPRQRQLAARRCESSLNERYELALAVRVALEVVRAQRGVDEADVEPEDAVFVGIA